jgi:hypothetical protein
MSQIMIYKCSDMAFICKNQISSLDTDPSLLMKKSIQQYTYAPDILLDDTNTSKHSNKHFAY